MAVITATWVALYMLYMRNARSYYKDNVIPLDSITHTSDERLKLLKLYFNRQQTYEFHGYAILFLALLFLFGCIYLFIHSERYIQIPSGSYNANDFWISLISLRVGISLIVFFICQVLLRLYRYCVKFAVFYIGLFDALLISEDLKVELKDAVGLFTPNVDIGDAPQSPTSELLKILANLNQVKSKAPGAGSGTQ